MDVSPGRAARRPALGYRRFPPRPLSLVLLLVLLTAGSVFSAGCFGGEEGDAAAGKTVESGDVQREVGKTAELRKVRVTMTSLGPTVRLALPDLTLARGSVPRLAQGQRYYQARVRVANRSAEPVRVDPQDFLLRGEDGLLAPDPAGSGPPGGASCPAPPSTSSSRTGRPPASRPRSTTIRPGSPARSP